MIISKFLNLIFYLLFFLISQEDAKEKRISNHQITVLFLVSVASLFLDETISFWDRMGGAIFLPAVFFLCWCFFESGFGAGDVKLISCIGLKVGFEMQLVALLTGLSGALLYAVISYIKTGEKKHIPLSPFLFAGLFVSMIWKKIAC